MIGYITIKTQGDTINMNRVMVKYSTHGELLQEVSKLIDETVELIKKDLYLVDLASVNIRNVSPLREEVHYVVDLVLNFNDGMA